METKKWRLHLFVKPPLCIYRLSCVLFSSELYVEDKDIIDGFVAEVIEE